MEQPMNTESTPATQSVLTKGWAMLASLVGYTPTMLEELDGRLL